MKRIYDPLIRTVLATTLYVVLSSPFIKLGSQTPKVALIYMVMFAIPVFIGMIIYDFAADKWSVKLKTK
jgi:hypothetical protein